MMICECEECVCNNNKKQPIRILLFAGNFYYPNGGVADLIDTFSCYESAKLAALSLTSGKADWAHTYDVETGACTSWRRDGWGNQRNQDGIWVPDEWAWEQDECGGPEDVWTCP